MGVIKGDTRSLDNGSVLMTLQAISKFKNCRLAKLKGFTLWSLPEPPMYEPPLHVHSRKLTWQPKKGPIKTTVPLNGDYMGFHVSLGECRVSGLRVEWYCFFWGPMFYIPLRSR